MQATEGLITFLGESCHHIRERIINFTNDKTKVLFFDIENAPNKAYVWGKWEQNVIDYDTEWYMLTFAAKWLGERKMMGYALPDFKTYKKDPENDIELVQKLWELLDEADVVIAHNGDRFDVRKTNARFLYHGMKPPSPYKTVDTKKIASRHFMLNSNSLDDIGKHLGLGEKIDTGGFELWLGCMNGEKKSWNKMLKYNKMDVTLLEKVYLALRHWMPNHPNLNIIPGTLDACPICGVQGKLQKRGFSITKVSKFQRVQCQDCGGWSRFRLAEKVTKPNIV